MSEQLTILDKSQVLLSPGFSVEQFKIENPTPFYIYVNASTLFPTATNKTYEVQPNSTFISPKISALNVAVTLAGFNVSTSVAKITVYSSATQQPSNIPYQTTQFVGNFPNYPFTIPIGSGNISLPSVQVEKFQNIYLIIDRALGGSNTPFAVFANNVQLGVVGGAGGVFVFSPTNVPSTVSFSITTPNSLDTARVVNVIQTADPISTDYYLTATPIGVAPVAYTVFQPVTPPYAILSIETLSDTPIVTPFNASIDVYYLPVSSLIGDEILLNSYSFNIPLTGVTSLINPKIYILADAGYFMITVQSNTANNMQPIKIRVFS